MELAAIARATATGYTVRLCPPWQRLPAAGSGKMPLPPCPVCAASASPEEPPGPDALDTLATQALEDWPSLLRPLLHPVVAALDAALSAGETPEQFRARLPGLLERMDIGPATESLAQSGFVARLAGELGIEP